MKAIELVRKVTTLGARLRAPRDGAGEAALATRAAVRLVKVTTALARQMQRLPVPPPRPPERLALSLAAAQLRAMADGPLSAALGRTDELARADAESPEAALAELVRETLALVDKVLAQAPELEGDDADRTARAPRLPEADQAPPIKVRF